MGRAGHGCARHQLSSDFIEHRNPAHPDGPGSSVRAHSLLRQQLGPKLKVRFPTSTTNCSHSPIGPITVEAHLAQTRLLNPQVGFYEMRKLAWLVQCCRFIRRLRMDPSADLY